MVHYPLVPPPPARRGIPRQFSISAMFALTALVAVGVALFKKDGLGILLFEDGGLFVLFGMATAMLALVGIAFGLAKLPAPAAAVVCVAMLLGVALAVMALTIHWVEVRTVILRVLDRSSKTTRNVDLTIFWFSVLAITIALGAILGFCIALSRERN